MGYISWYLCFVAYINCFSLYHQFILTAHHVPLGFNIHENDGHFITRAIPSHPFSSLFHLSHTNSRAPSAEVPLDYISIALQSLRAVDARFFNAQGCSCRHVQHQWPDVETRQSVHGFPSSPFLGVACALVLHRCCFSETTHNATPFFGPLGLALLLLYWATLQTSPLLTAHLEGTHTQMKPTSDTPMSHSSPSSHWPQCGLHPVNKMPSIDAIPPCLNSVTLICVRDNIMYTLYVRWWHLHFYVGSNILFMWIQFLNFYVAYT